MPGSTMNAREKIRAIGELAAIVRGLQGGGRQVVFTNGCFDLLHRGHVRHLEQARALGDCLVLGLNSDRSVRALKGEGRPIVPADERAEVLAALACVDYVCIFDAPDPAGVIAALKPDVLVKGGDWAPEAIVGREIVEARGGRVLSLPYVEGASTSALIRRILARQAGGDEGRPRDRLGSSCPPGAAGPPGASPPPGSPRADPTGQPTEEQP